MLLNNFKKHRFLDIDMIAFALYLLLVLIGSVNLYAASIPSSNASLSSFFKQFIYIFLTFFLGLIVYKSDFHYQRFALSLYWWGILLLLGLFVFGTRINGAVSWYQIGSFSFQPSECAKISTLLLIASLFEKRAKNEKACGFRASTTCRPGPKSMQGQEQGSFPRLAHGATRSAEVP